MDAILLLGEQLLTLLQGARFWDKSCEWMQVHRVLPALACPMYSLPCHACQQYCHTVLEHISVIPGMGMSM